MTPFFQLAYENDVGYPFLFSSFLAHLPFPHLSSHNLALSFTPRPPQVQGDVAFPTLWARFQHVPRRRPALGAPRHNGGSLLVHHHLVVAWDEAGAWDRTRYRVLYVKFCFTAVPDSLHALPLPLSYIFFVFLPRPPPPHPFSTTDWYCLLIIYLHLLYHWFLFISSYVPSLFFSSVSWLILRSIFFSYFLPATLTAWLKFP